MKRVKSWLNTIHGRMFMVSASVIMMVIACMVLVFHRNVQRDMDTQVRLAQQEATETSLSELDIYLSTLMAKTDVLFVNDEFASLLSTQPVTLSEQIHASHQMRTLMDYAMFNLRYAEVPATTYRGGSAYGKLYLLHPNVYIDNLGIFDFADIADEPFVRRLNEHDEVFSWSCLDLKGAGQYLHFNRWMLDAAKTQRMALLQVRIPLAKIEAVLMSKLTPYQLAAFYLSEDGEVVCAKGDRSLLPLMQAEQLDSGFIVGDAVSSLNGYRLVTIYDARLSSSRMASLSVFYWLCGGVGILLSGILLFFISRSLLKGIKRLVEKEKLATEAPDQYVKMPKITGSQEIVELDDSCVQLVNTINSLHAKEAVYQATINEVQAELMQEQFNPHLLYNTLSLVNYKAQEQGQQEISDVLTSLIKFYKQVLNRGQMIYTIQKEMCMIENYLSIVRQVYNIDLTFTLRVSEEAQSFYSVKMFLQPLVENAVLHGIRQIGSGTLTITGEKEGGMLHFVVEDDGAGMEEEALARLREVLDCGNNAHPDHSYGISSVARRLYLVFNNNYRMTVDSELGMGTRVELWIPALREEQINATLAHRMI